MNILLWTVQATLALLYFAGGAYKLVAFDELAPHLDALSRGAWGALGVFEMVGAVLLIAPAATKRMAGVTPIAAALLALEALGLAALYSRYSLELTVANPLVWAAAMGVLASVVAYGRYTQAAGLTHSGRASV